MDTYKSMDYTQIYNHSLLNKSSAYIFTHKNITLISSRSRAQLWAPEQISYCHCYALLEIQLFAGKLPKFLEGLNPLGILQHANLTVTVLNFVQNVAAIITLTQRCPEAPILCIIWLKQLPRKWDTFSSYRGSNSHPGVDPGISIDGLVPQSSTHFSES